MQLDLGCPIPWPCGGMHGRSTSSVDQATLHGSPTSCAAVSRKAEPMLVLIGQTSPRKEDPSSRTDLATDTLSSWLSRRYAETLWLGEHHSPLVGFLKHVAHLESRSSSPFAAMQDLRTLLRTRAQIRQRFSDGTDDGAAGYASRHKLLAILDGATLDDGGSTQEAIEEHVIRSALSAGPANVVTNECRSSKQNALGRLGRLWNSAIETRELQLQVLVILCLLRLNAEHPLSQQQQQQQQQKQQDATGDLATPSSPGRTHVPDGVMHRSDANRLAHATDDISPPSQKKRKRKAERSQRWTGRNNIFPWQLGRPSTASDAATPGVRTASASLLSFETSTEPEALLKRFESLVDTLCLRVATTGISLDLDDDDGELAKLPESGPSSEEPPRTPSESPAATARRRRAAGHRVIVPPFGSEGRKRDGAKDERDVMQWFCCQVVEASFSKSLPRQCGTIRSRCYLPAAVTPAKAVQRKRPSEKAGKRPLSSKASQTLQANLQERGAGPNDADASGALQAGPLQRSLLDEDRSRLQRTQSFAAAKRRTTWDAREVNVRRRWERSHSVGPTMGGLAGDRAKLAGGGTQSMEAGKTGRADRQMHHERQSDPSIVDARKPNGDQPFTLVLGTPAKARPVHMLQARKKGEDAALHQTKARREPLSRMPSVSSARQTLASSPWRRSESQPVLAMEQHSSVFAGGDPHVLDDIADDELQDADDEQFGAEILDESLRSAFSDDESEGDASDQADIFGSYIHRLAPDLQPPPNEEESIGAASDGRGDDVAVQIEAHEETFAAFDDLDEETERVVLSKRIRTMTPSLLPFQLPGSTGMSFAAAGQSNALATRATEQQTTHPAAQPTSISARPGLHINSPRRTLSGRNPFAIRARSP